MSKNIEIRIEVEREFIVESDRSGAGITLFCSKCGRDEQMFYIDDAALAVRSNSRSIFGQIESGALHSVENNDGLLLVCRDSLLRSANQKTEKGGGNAAVPVQKEKP
jgi:hypothetical protein